MTIRLGDHESGDSAAENGIHDAKLDATHWPDWRSGLRSEMAMSGDQSIGWFQYLTFAVAVTGAILGVINTWRSWSRDQPRLRVRCVRAYPVGGHSLIPTNACGIEVTNLSAFPLVISEVGFGLHKTKDRMVVLNPYLPGNEQWPRTLPPREQFTAYADLDLFDKSRMVKDVYATTACGTTVRKKQRKLRELLSLSSKR